MTAEHRFFSPHREPPIDTVAAPPSAGTEQSPAGRWWMPGVFCGAPALFLWLVARLPENLLAQVFRGGASMPVVLNQLGDALFFCGWAISAILLWGERRRVRGQHRR